MRRILVVGITGAGKSTLARALGERLELPFHEMDALHFSGPGWETSRTFAGDVARIVGTPGWVFDSFGQAEVRDLLWAAADTVVWLDYPRRRVMPRVLRRSVRRTVRRERIFGGNRETLREWFSRDHPAWSAWAQHGARRAEIRRRLHDPAFAPLRVIRFDVPAEARAWLDAVGPDPADHPAG